MPSLKDAQRIALDEATAQYLREALTVHGGDVNAVARCAQIARESVYRLLRRHHVDLKVYRAGDMSEP